jgi:hypothetical protein
MLEAHRTECWRQILQNVGGRSYRMLEADPTECWRQILELEIDSTEKLKTDPTEKLTI